MSMIQAADVGESSNSTILYLTLPETRLFPCFSRHRNCGQGRKTSLPRRRLLRHSIQSPHQAPHVAWPQLLPSFRQTRPVRHPPRSHHFSDASCVLGDILLCTDCIISRMAHDRLCDDLYDGARVFISVGHGRERRFGIDIPRVVQGAHKGTRQVLVPSACVPRRT